MAFKSAPKMDRTMFMNIDSVYCYSISAAHSKNSTSNYERMQYNTEINLILQLTTGSTTALQDQKKRYVRIITIQKKE